jgi:hypothetical protein
MPLKCHYCLHPLVEFEKGIVDQRVENDSSLNICKMIVRMDLINRALLFSSVIKCMSKTSNVHFNGEKNMRVCFS